MMIDFVLYDPAFKEELAGIVREVMQEEMAKFSEEYAFSSFASHASLMISPFPHFTLYFWCEIY